MKEKASKLGDITLDGSKRMARLDEQRIKRAKIKSPNTGKMHRVSYGNTTYFFYNKKKMNRFIEKNIHHQLLGIHLDEENRHKPDITEKFNMLNLKLKEDGI